METSDIIKAFAEKTTLPVDVNDVLKLLQDNGCDDDIEFIGVDLDPDVLQGQIKIFHIRKVPYGDPCRCANIYYHRGHDPDWQRFICCKELLHLLDPESARTNDLEAIGQLAEKIGLPPEMQDPMSDGLATNIDRLAEFRAAAILLPWACRGLLMEPLRQNLLTIDDIARMADIPRRYAALVMHPSWERLHAMLAM